MVESRKLPNMTAQETTFTRFAGTWSPKSNATMTLLEGQLAKQWYSRATFAWYDGMVTIVALFRVAATPGGT
jgi:hypothetical protein